MQTENIISDVKFIYSPVECLRVSLWQVGTDKEKLINPMLEKIAKIVAQTKNSKTAALKLNLKVQPIFETFRYL